MAATTRKPKKKSGRAAKSAYHGHPSADFRLGLPDLREIADRVFKFSDADETEVKSALSVDALTRFANNTIHQNVAEQNLAMSVRTVFDGRTARATPTRPTKLRCAAWSRGIESGAQCSRKIRTCCPCPASRNIKKSTLLSQTPQPQPQRSRPRRSARLRQRHENQADRRRNFLHWLDRIRPREFTRPFCAYEQTRAEFSVTILEKDSSGWAKANSPDLTDIDPEALAESASEKSTASRKPREIPAGHYTVILEPPAVLDLVGFLFYDFAGTAVLDQRSCFTGRMGKKLFGENISIWDDVYHPLQTGAPYDGEGMPRQKVLARGSRRAAKSGLFPRHRRENESQAHRPRLLAPNEYGEAPMNLVFAGGTATVDEMVRSTDRGVLVTRLWYIREVDPYEKILTGMTRDGTFLIENGRVAGGIRNFRFNQSMIKMLSNVEMLGVPVRAAGEESFEMVVPAMKIRDFHFSEVTKF